MHLIALLSVLLFVGVTQASINYIGCYADNYKYRAMEQVLVEHFRTDMTNRRCADECRDLGYEFAGTQKGKLCYCSSTHDFAMYGKRNDTFCNVVCTGARGDRSKKCGGMAMNSVYSTGMLYVGCFADTNIEGRRSASIPTRSVLECVKACSNQMYYNYAALHMTSCTCLGGWSTINVGVAGDNIGAAGEEKCNNQCPTWKPDDIYRPGFSDKYCGGIVDDVAYFSIYRTLG